MSEVSRADVDSLRQRVDEEEPSEELLAEVVKIRNAAIREERGDLISDITDLERRVRMT